MKNTSIFTAFLVVIVLSVFSSLSAQTQNDPVLFTVEGKDVPVSEFEYIYQKNNRDDANYSRSSIDEYLDLYVKFKLKVQRARELQLDTIQSLQDELGGYRNQLAKSYLNDKEVKSRLVQELYQRMQSDVHLAHILIKVSNNAKGEELSKAQAKIDNAYDRLKAGESFEKVAKEISEDSNTKDQGGDLGYLTAKFPNGFYAFETAAYSLKPGEFSKPVRTALGLHILKLHDKRPARGEVDASHILARVGEDGSESKKAEQKINQIYKNLEGGADFEELARSMSEDSESAPKGGYIGSFGINTYEQIFEDAVFNLPEDQEYSKPIRTSLGWHIVKRVKKKDIPPFEAVERKLEGQITRDERINIARESMVGTIMKESGFRADSAVLENILEKLDQSFYTYQWTAPELREATLITFDDGTTATNTEFMRWLRINARSRLRLDKEAGLDKALYAMFDDFTETQCLAYEERNLERKYPEFKALMREYEEGILLFEVTKMAVWDKAAQDTAGLNKYFQAHRDKYMWPERLLITEYTLDSNAIDKMPKILKWEKKMDPSSLAQKVNKKEEILSFQTRKIDQKDVGDLPWTAGYISEPMKTPAGTLQFTKVEKIIQPEHKNLNEARGYIIADYQDQLEKEWIADLKSRYEVKINEPVVEKLIKT